MLREGADFIVMDCGSLVAGPDAAVIARMADVTVLVVPPPESAQPADRQRRTRAGRGASRADGDCDYQVARSSGEREAVASATV